MEVNQEARMDSTASIKMQEMPVLHLRCPGCNKKYFVESATIHSASPRFQCRRCESHFTFSFPPTDWSVVPTRFIPDAKTQFKTSKSTLSQPEPFVGAPKVKPKSEFEKILDELNQKAQQQKILKLAKKADWSRLAWQGGLILSLSMILIGLVEPILRNMVGAGSAVLILMIGFRALLSPEFQWKDLFR